MIKINQKNRKVSLRLQFEKNEKMWKKIEKKFCTCAIQ